jgi:tRNA pseudouridine(55) synthase
MAYAGRLDPMASGKILVLIGNACKEIVHHRTHDKRYVVEILLGASTDTGDLLGLPIISNESESNPVSDEAIQNALSKLVGNHNWEYPIFSSRTVKGKPLFQWFYEGKIAEIKIPKTKTRIYSARMLNTRIITSAELLKHITESIARITTVTAESKKLGNDFRRTDILAAWKSKLVNVQTYTIVSVEIDAGSGSYMRTFAGKYGELLGIPALAFSITRTKIGKRRTFLGIPYWFPSY